MTDDEIAERLAAQADQMEAAGCPRPRLVVSNVRQVRDVARRLGFEARCAFQGRRAC